MTENDRLRAPLRCNTCLVPFSVTHVIAVQTSSTHPSGLMCMFCYGSFNLISENTPTDGAAP